MCLRGREREREQCRARQLCFSLKMYTSICVCGCVSIRWLTESWCNLALMEKGKLLDGWVLKQKNRDTFIYIYIYNIYIYIYIFLPMIVWDYIFFPDENCNLGRCGIPIKITNKRCISRFLSRHTVTHMLLVQMLIWLFRTWLNVS